jgi:hypothetical protein
MPNQTGDQTGCERCGRTDCDARKKRPPQAMTSGHRREKIAASAQGASMLAKLLLALALLFPPLAPHAWAGPKAEAGEKQCPHELSAFDKISQDVDKAPSCSAALELFSACALGGSSDVRLGGSVVERCERDFLSALSKAQKRAYQAEQKRCARKYSRQEGTMYRSATAFCLAEAAEKYARRFAKGGAGAGKK